MPRLSMLAVIHVLLFLGLKQLFAEGQMFSYDLEDWQYYLDYVRLMDHWDAARPGLC